MQLRRIERLDTAGGTHQPAESKNGASVLTRRLERL